MRIFGHRFARGFRDSAWLLWTISRFDWFVIPEKGYTFWVTRRTAKSAGSSGSAVLPASGVVAPGGRRTLERAPLVIESLKPLEPGFYAGLPQVARLAVFARDERAVLITTPERVKLYRDLPVLGRGVSINPGIAEWSALENHVVLDIDTALEDFPSDETAFRLELAVGQKYTREEFLDRLEGLGYERESNLDASDLEKTEGYFNVIGDTLQIRINKRGDTVRAEFFGDELETLRLNDEKVNTYSLEPLGDFVPEVAWDSTRLERLPGRVYLDAAEFFDGYLLHKQIQKLWGHLATRAVISFSNTRLNLEQKTSDLEPLPFYRARLKMFAADAKFWLENGYRVQVLLKHERTGTYLQSNVLNAESDVSSVWEWRAEAQPGKVTLTLGTAEGAFIHHGAKLAVLTEDSLYGFQGGSSLRMRKLRGSPVSDATALTLGDYLIHPEHGIGQFLGLEARQILGATRDYIQLKYANDARIFLPVEQLPMLKRHPGTTDDPPRLSTLGTNDWTKAREKARKNAEELAQKLLVQYAARQATPGTSYPNIDNEWDTSFAANFPFEFTKDQARAVKDVYKDLETTRPMDRLVSGDVGFGKTEVAVRAAHRVVSNGRQVAVLVPTTLLAEQHLETFRKRFEDTPVIVAGLSRFTTPKDAEAVFKNLKAGKVDIVVGTHRLLSEQLGFKNLGLLIIDEEHRFGVMQKEKLKALKAGELSLSSFKDVVLDSEKDAKPKARKKDAPKTGLSSAASDLAMNLEALAGNVIGAKKEKVDLEPENAIDVLTLSATPIPRTLYMSMVGLRDMSHIATPPAGRKPIQTVLSPYDPFTIRDAILFEMERGGKCFYIHDRVASIQRRAKYIQELVPEARIAVAHGQMPDGEIEEIMQGFEEGAFDVLLATTIVESGLDIPEANTILIERSDRLGLAQLYQLRGRVGRRQTEAYAYFFYPPRLSENAERRLWAIADLTDLGSGHLLAEKDMEIRGVGNILGPEQHGHIQNVSLEVYTELLSEAIQRLKGDTKPMAPRLAIDLKVNARLEPTYIPEELERIEYYGRLSESTTLGEISRVERELKSKHGSVPLEVQNFLDLARLRVLGTAKGVMSISETITQLVVNFAPNAALDYDAKAVKANAHKMTVTKYPSGFTLEKKGLKPDEYAKVILEALYAFA
jgi:transcription-repair coupling factor (superfamily II helicase)